MYLDYIIPISIMIILLFSIVFFRQKGLMKKKERILVTASESAILLKNISGDVYIESRAYTRWIFFEKTKVMLDKSTIYLLPNKTVLGNNLLGIVQIDVGKNNQFVNKMYLFT